MATTEHNGLMVYKGSDGNNKVLYPLTKADLVDGLEELLAELRNGKADLSALTAHTGRKDNPHGVTLSQIGAAASGHKHAASDITSGILPASRGGTGFSSLDQLIATIPGAKIAFGTYNGTGTYGKSNPNKLTLDFPAKMVIIVDYLRSDSYIASDGYAGYESTDYAMILTKYRTIAWNPSTTNVIGYKVFPKFDGNDVYWYTTASKAECQGNAAGGTSGGSYQHVYGYIAIG